MPEAAGQRSSAFELLPEEDAAGRKLRRPEPFLPAVIDPEWIELHAQREFVMEWWVDDAEEAAVRFPFVFVPYPETPQYFGIRVISGPEYFYWTGENVTPLGDSATNCKCGEQLAYWTGFAAGIPAQRIHRQCPTCNRTFDPVDTSCDVLDAWTGKPRALPGGLTFGFGLQVDCHKNFPHDEEGFRRFCLHDAFLELWRTHVAVPYDVVETAG